MSAIGFLLAPKRDIPPARDENWMATVQSWLHIANWAWFELWQALPEEQRRGAPRMPPGAGLSSNAMDASRKQDPDLVVSARPWAEQSWKAWNDSGRKAPLPVADAAAAHEALALDSRMSLANLVGYRGGYTPVPPGKLKRGGALAFVKNEGDPNAFAFGEQDGVERALFLELARGHGGDHLAVWTFGRALHILVARSLAPGVRPTLFGPLSVRTRVAAGAKRPGGFVEALEAALDGGALEPDFDALRRDLSRPELSVEACFAALGIPGARDFASPEAAALWEQLDRVAAALLTGQAADKTQVKALNDVLEPLGDLRLPAKGKLGKGETARAVARATVELRDALGVPESGPWKDRFRAAALYWDIADSAAGQRLTVGADKAGLGTAASLARLLTHFPDAHLRDPVFLALLALECEAANGHAYVEGLSKLAEETGAAGLVLVAAPAALRPALRKALGISAVDDSIPPDGAWCGEASIAGTTIAKGNVTEAARAFMTKAKATGAVAELPADGATSLTWYKAGAEVEGAKAAGLGLVDPAALSAAAKGLRARAGFVALGAGDPLAPGEWREGAFSGQSAPGAEDHRVRKRRHAETVLARATAAQPIASVGALLPVLGPSLRYSGPLSETDGGIVSLRVTLARPDAAWLRDLRNDLKGRSVIGSYGEAWADHQHIRAYSCSDLDVALLAQVLADAPSGTTLAVGVGADLLGAWSVS